MNKLRKLIWSLLFFAGGAAIGFLYYTFWGCRTGCPITSSPLHTMLYMGIVGLLLSGAVSRPKSL